MTISLRNKYFVGGIIFSVLSLALISFGGYYAYGVLDQAASKAAFRAEGLVNSFSWTFTEASGTVSFFAMMACALYSLLGIILIFYYFEKTHSSEILFFGFFVISHSFEFIRILIPIREIYHIPSIYLVYTSRFLLFGRFFGLLSLFTSALYAAGLDIQKQQTSFFLIVMASLVISMNIPVNSINWDTSYKLIYAYKDMFNLAELGIIIITIISYFVSAYKRGSKTYNYIGVAILLIFFGRNTLLSSDNWFTLVPGFIALAAGTWTICTRLHREYLWL